MDNNLTPKRSKINFKKWYDFIMLFLIIYVLGQLAIEIIVPFRESTSLILSRIDFTICIIFLTDWFYFLFKSESKKLYIKKNWIGLLASIPFTQILRPLRFFRLFRIAKSFRLLKGLRGASPLFRFLLKNKSRSALSIYLFLTTIIYSYCSLGMYNFEKGINESINGFPDVLWMSFTTLTSVGYGDIYPVTGGGRIMAAILVITGMGLFSLLTAEFATLILSFTKTGNENKTLEEIPK
ncbi:MULTISPECIES: ion transporter [unclassified Oceanispirochaeta]|uniref:ion transporter n=1 Tax=unclassified Oceanispirochaeta TaxID=2635722 RepID=UPI000E098EB8|nr:MULTISPECIES: ion transporter [unclassified Oceanispirochaeta]MBF9018754.1 ion transporter [Oceanispirochaeta sp. M2]NPD75192.1 ion transporter [Oceanispirochaeta sp. M1]RDG28975.1 ion transporter [Oceanispirochaeta sp. M1]